MSKKTIEIYKHETQRRKNNPQVGAVTSQTDSPKVKTKQYKYDPHLDPELKWAGKAERLAFEAPTVPLHIHEKIDPRSIIETVRSRNSVDYEQMSLFHDPTERRALEKEIEFYKHEKLWSNRLIAGDSLLVMNSLLNKEGMQAKVQCVYIDPPYGIKYGSNFQPFVNKRDVKDKKDEDLTAEPEMIKAFRDTWELGIHSYLTYLRDRLLLARELLTDSGSCFVQISDENVHLVRNLMDEVFGRDNFVSQITIKRASVMFTKKYLKSDVFYVIFYAKNFNHFKYRQLYTDKDIQLFANSAGSHLWCENTTNNKCMRLEPKDRKDIKKLLSDHSNYTLFHTLGLNAQGTEKQKPFNFKDVDYFPPKGTQWKTSYTGLGALVKANRIIIEGNRIRYKCFYKDFKISEVSNYWKGIGPAGDKIYVVQTNDEIVKNCLLMTTDPGDLVLDPTCGSGTTAYVAEKWGRRWITCDTSRVAIALAKQRLMTAHFDYYELKNEKQGVNGNFNYKEVPHITLKSIANNPHIKEGMTKQEIEKAISDHAPTEKLYDKPHIDKNKFRVSGPFTVEAIPAVKVETLSGDLLNGSNSLIKQDWFHSLKEHGIKGKKGLSKDIEFTRLEMMSDTQYIYGEGEIKETGKTAIICFGSEYAPLEQRQVEEALKEAKAFRPDVVIFCAFQFDPEASKDVDESDLKWTKVLKVQMNSDLLTHDLKKKTKGESFWLVGQPDVKVEKLTKDKGKYKVSIQGFDYYNTKTNSMEKGGKDKIAIWMLDTNYDERSLYPRQVFFPLSGNKDGWAKLKKSLKTEINEELIDKFKGTESLAFKAENHKKIAVKIIDDRGIESLIIKALD